MSVIADTSFIVAVLNIIDRNHVKCVEVYDRQIAIVVPQSVLTETAYMLANRIGPRATIGFLDGLATSNFDPAPLEKNDIRRISEILKKYADSRVDFVDASVAAVAERLGITQVLTLDRRDFEIIRPSHVEHFEILPG